MKLEILWLFSGLASVILLLGGIFYRISKRADFIVFSFRNKTFSFSIPDWLRVRENQLFLSAPYIRPVNEFMTKFVNSGDRKIEFNADDMQLNEAASPILKSLQGLDYERVRLRLRAISNLNPVVNLEAEEGRIRFTFSGQEMELRAVFAAKGACISLEKF